jgi:protease-4
MKTTAILTMVLGLLLVLAGCGGGQNTGFLITPVPLDEKLAESVVQSDAAWLETAKIAIVDVEGLLINERGGLLFGSGENPVEQFAEKLALAASDKQVKAVLLRINSPGGTVQASQMMYDALRSFREKTHKPVFAHILDLGASGGYYVACGADKINAQSTSITGSIGVLIQTVSFSGTMRKLGISAEAIKSGPMKDMASPLRDMSPEDRKVLQVMVDEFYGQFLQVVGENRKNLKPERVKELADGRVYTGQQALALGLVDQVCTLEDSLAALKKAAGLRGAKVVMYHRPIGNKTNIYSQAQTGSNSVSQINLVNLQAGASSELFMLRRPCFLFLWSLDN